jgi:hypothetical protein
MLFLKRADSRYFRAKKQCGGDGSLGQVVECLSTKAKAVSSSPSTAKEGGGREEIWRVLHRNLYPVPNNIDPE